MKIQATKLEGDTAILRLYVMNESIICLHVDNGLQYSIVSFMKNALK